MAHAGRPEQGRITTMANIFGADLSDLAALQGTFETKAGEVQALTGELSAKVDPAATAWQGPGADNFRAAWNGDFKPALTKLETALEEAAVAVGKYRENIEAATR